MSRIICPPGEQRRFILEVLKKSGLTVVSLAKYLHTGKTNIHHWKNSNGKNHAPYEIISKLANEFHISMPAILDIKDENWGRRKGAVLGLLKWSHKRVNTFYVPQKNTLLAEFCGIVLGDGGVTNSQCQISLNSEADLAYITNVNNMIKTLFHCKVGNYKDKRSKVITTTITGVRFIILLKKFGIFRGDKVRRQADVPEWIKKSLTFSTACLRGLMDTDGGIFVHSYIVNGKRYSYLNLSFKNASMPLIIFVRNTLKTLGFHPKIQDERNVWLYTKKEVLQYIFLVGSTNPRLYKHLGIYPGLHDKMHF